MSRAEEAIRGLCQECQAPLSPQARSEARFRSGLLLCPLHLQMHLEIENERKASEMKTVNNLINTTDTPESQLRVVHAFSDGACANTGQNTGGKEGYSVVYHLGEKAQAFAKTLVLGPGEKATNNHAELLGIRLALTQLKESVRPGTHLVVRSDSQWAVRSLNGEYKSKEHPELRAEILTLAQGYGCVEFRHIVAAKNNDPFEEGWIKEGNALADWLATQAAGTRQKDKEPELSVPYVVGLATQDDQPPVTQVTEPQTQPEPEGEPCPIPVGTPVRIVSHIEAPDSAIDCPTWIAQEGELGVVKAAQQEFGDCGSYWVFQLQMEDGRLVDTWLDEIAPTQPVETQPAQTRSLGDPRRPLVEVPECSGCKVTISKGVQKYSQDLYGKALCMKCQQRTPRPQLPPKNVDLSPESPRPARTESGIPEYVGVVGGRNLNTEEWREYIWEKLDRLATRWGKFAVVSGEQPEGVDGFAKAWALDRGHEYIPCPPKAWVAKELFARNQVIVDRSNCIVAFWDGESPGTRDTLKKAKAVGKQVFDVLAQPMGRPHF